ncbi:MAG TPA: hypothetical protein VKP58_06570 [Candidatus Acidoferrum sp.]|nr:hypothetical protein [Candidatus Acidoferrum sp.]
MNKKAQTGMRQLFSRRRSWLCLLVAITFLYNPFLVAATGLGGCNVSHLPSFRATVASLELVKSAPEEKRETTLVPDGDVRWAPPVSPLREYTTRFEKIDASSSVSAQFLPQGNLFFRPPPAA